jgi:hypothetical protein
MGPLQITATHEQRYHDQHLDLDFEHKTVLLDTKPLGLTRKEYDLLALLIQNAGEVVTRECCCCACGATATRSARGRWTCISAGCARSWASTAARISRPSSAWGTGFSPFVRPGWK